MENFCETLDQAGSRGMGTSCEEYMVELVELVMYGLNKRGMVVPPHCGPPRPCHIIVPVAFMIKKIGTFSLYYKKVIFLRVVLHLGIGMPNVGAIDC